MSTRELILLSPYRLPTQHSGMYGNDDVACWLNGYLALWHPAAAQGAERAPHVASPYDHEEPTAGHVYAVPEQPPLILPDDWDERVRAAGACAFRAVPDREQTLANLKEALRSLPAASPLSPGGRGAGGEGGEQAPTGAPPDLGSPSPSPPAPLPLGERGEAGANAPCPPEAPPVPLETLLDQAPARVAPFFGIGFGTLHVNGLFEAMEHENLLAATELWQDVQQAVAGLGRADADAVHAALQSAHDRLLSAREVLYPTNLLLLDVALLDEQRLDVPFPATFDRGLPFVVVASAAVLEKLAEQHPDRLTALAERIPSDLAEVCGGPYVETPDALLPVESQLGNLTTGLARYQELLGQEVRVFARKHSAAHPQLPLLLQHVGLTRALFVPFDDAVLPTYRATVVNWPSPDGKQVEAFTRAPYNADTPQTYFHVAHYLHKSITQDQAATLALLHNPGPAAPWYHDWLELSRFGPALGKWVTLSQYFNEVLTGEYTSAAQADEFHADVLSERTAAHSPQPVSWFARHARLRRRVDAVWALAALHRGLAGAGDTLQVSQALEALERRAQREGPDAADLNQALLEVQTTAAQALAARLQARASENTPGYLLLNPCSYTRRVALELDDVGGPLPLVGPVKACQHDGGTTRLVVEVPPLGFAWFPKSSGGPQAPGRMRLAENHLVRNEFFEADIDPLTGGLKGIRDHRTRVNRLGQQLVFNPGSTMRAKEVKVTSAGPALGEIVSEGAILDEHDNVLATFRQRFRAWLGRPLLDLRLSIFPAKGPEGYPWHAYYGARFAWRDERATLLRGVNGTGCVTTHTRPVTPDYLELRLGRLGTTVFPCGLPFHQRHAGRMVDVILIPEGETATVFDLAIGLDREAPMQTAQGLISPAPVVATTRGAPHVGATGWLFHLDAPNLMLSSFRPAADGADAVLARLLECAAHGGPVEFRCVRDPKRAVLLDARGTQSMDATVHGDAVQLEVPAGDLFQLRIDFQ